MGYIQLETASAMMNNLDSNQFNENTFTFDSTVTTNKKMTEVYHYIMEKIAEIKVGKSQIVQPSVQKSTAGELKEFHELLVAGIITQEEFDAKKKQLLS